MNKCTHCGAENLSHAEYCKECCKPIAGKQAPQTQPPVRNDDKNETVPVVDLARRQTILERIGRRVMLVSSSFAWWFAGLGGSGPGAADGVLPVGLMIFVFPIIVGIVSPVAAFKSWTTGIHGPERGLVILLWSAFAAALVYIALFGTLGLVKGLLARMKKAGWSELRRQCLSDRLLVSRTVFVGMGLFVVSFVGMGVLVLTGKLLVSMVKSLQPLGH